jgi:hypothetical protein
VAAARVIFYAMLPTDKTLSRGADRITVVS